MLLLSRIRTNPQLKTLARRLEKRLKRVLVAALQRMLPPPSPETIDSLEGVTRILIIRPNFRLGNALISTPVIDALRQRFPAARIDYLTTKKRCPSSPNSPWIIFMCYHARRFYALGSASRCYASCVLRVTTWRYKSVRARPPA